VYSVCEVVLPLSVNPQFVNAQETSLSLQAAIKNLATNSVFYFAIPISLECLFAGGAGMELNSFVAAWKGIEESLEVSAVVNGKH
jgi:hypothetical protein